MYRIGNQIMTLFEEAGFLNESKFEHNDLIEATDLYDKLYFNPTDEFKYVIRFHEYKLAAHIFAFGVDRLSWLVHHWAAARHMGFGMKVMLELAKQIYRTRSYKTTVYASYRTHNPFSVAVFGGIEKLVNDPDLCCSTPFAYSRHDHDYSRGPVTQDILAPTDLYYPFTYKPIQGTYHSVELVGYTRQLCDLFAGGQRIGTVERRRAKPGLNLSGFFNCNVYRFDPGVSFHYEHLPGNPEVPNIWTPVEAITGCTPDFVYMLWQAQNVEEVFKHVV